MMGLHPTWQVAKPAFHFIAYYKIAPNHVRKDGTNC